MEILFVVPYAPNLVRVRSYHLLRSLVRRGHRITLATVWTSNDERADLDRLAGEGIHVQACHLPAWRSVWNCLRAAPSTTPLQAAYCWQPALARQLRLILHQSHVDIVHVEHLRGARYALGATQLFDAAAPGLPTARSLRPAIVWDSVDCISDLFEQAARGSRRITSRLITRMELPRTRSYERWMLGQVDRVLVTSELDRRALLSLSPKTTRGPNRRIHSSTDAITVLPNGVDLEHFTPADQPRERATLVITGKMSYHANVAAVLHLIHDIMPRVWVRRPEVRVYVVGKDPPRVIRRLGSAAPSGEERAPRVTVTGSVADIRPYLRLSTLAVAPVPYGAGIQNKVLEAMACGIPVVASPRAASAISVRSGQELVLADGAEAFAQAVLALLEDPARQAELGRAGRRYVEAHHSWTAVAGQLEDIYRSTQDALASRAGQQR